MAGGYLPSGLRGAPGKGSPRPAEDNRLRGRSNKGTNFQSFSTPPCLLLREQQPNLPKNLPIFAETCRNKAKQRLYKFLLRLMPPSVLRTSKSTALLSSSANPRNRCSVRSVCIGGNDFGCFLHFYFRQSTKSLFCAFCVYWRPSLLQGQATTAKYQ